MGRIQKKSDSAHFAKSLGVRKSTRYQNQARAGNEAGGFFRLRKD
jgi:hypothetical protein